MPIRFFLTSHLCTFAREKNTVRPFNVHNIALMMVVVAAAASVVLVVLVLVVV